MTAQLLPFQDALVGGKYRLGPVIGSGGVGTVYRATHLWTEREVAVKILDPSLPHFDQLRDAFLREARTTVQLDHPNVVDVLDMGEDDAHTAYLVMELLDGPTLRDVLLEQGRLSSEDTLAILLPLVDALEKAHELGIIHRDFKPENVILSVDPFDVTTPKLLDFGVAQILRESRPRRFGDRDTVIVGTPQYMSPEQARDDRERIGPHTDVWGVGVVWYECLTGRPPFDADTALEVLTAVCEAPVDFSGVPEAHVSILRDALHRSPDRRIQSLSDLRARIEDSELVARPRAGKRAAASSWPSPETRPSYVRRTLHGMGPNGLGDTGARSVQLDSELLSLPLGSHRRAVVGGLALTCAVALAAWWTIGSPEPDAAMRTEPVVVDPPIQAVRALASPREVDPNTSNGEPLAAAPELKPEPEPKPELGASAEQAIPNATPEGVKPDPGRSPTRRAPDTLIKPASAASSPASQDEPQDASPSRGYEKPPELVTEW